VVVGLERESKTVVVTMQEVLVVAAEAEAVARLLEGAVAAVEYHQDRAAVLKAAQVLIP
jgi:hypothetical protein